MKPSRVSSLLAGLVLLNGACSTYEPPRTEAISDAIDLSRLETFTISVNGSDTLDTAFGAVRRNEAMSEIAEELEDRGFEYVTGPNADFKVVFTSAIQDPTSSFTTSYSQPSQKIVTTEEQVVTPTGERVTTERRSRVVTTRDASPITTQTRQRLFVLDIVDGGSNALLWRGYMTSDDLELEDEEELEDRIEEIIELVPGV